MRKDQIKITSDARDELSSSVIFGDEKYLVQTEREGAGNLRVTTYIYINGKVISKTTADQGDVTDKKDFDEVMRKQHRSVIEMLKFQKTGGEKKEISGAVPVQEVMSPSDYLKTVKTLLMRKNQRSALEALKEGLEQYPENPFILAYYGCLEAIVNKKYRFGINMCKKAMSLLEKKVPFGEEFFYPIFYLNLGRAYLASGKRKDAVAAFKKGLETDTGNSDLLMELSMLGVRKKSPVTFLSRSNPINKYIGMLLRKLGR